MEAAGNWAKDCCIKARARGFFGSPPAPPARRRSARSTNGSTGDRRRREQAVPSFAGSPAIHGVPGLLASTGRPRGACSRTAAGGARRDLPPGGLDPPGLLGGP